MPCPTARGAQPQPLASFVPDPALMFDGFGAYFPRPADEPPAVNSPCLCGHTTLRHAAMSGLYRPVTEAETATMRALLDLALEQGAAGMIALTRQGRIVKGQRVVFLHTGGAAALLGYDRVLTR